MLQGKRERPEQQQRVYLGGGGHGNPLQYSCQENPMDRVGRWATVHGVAKSWTRLKRLSTHACAARETEATKPTFSKGFSEVRTAVSPPHPRVLDVSPGRW